MAYNKKMNRMTHDLYHDVCLDHSFFKSKYLSYWIVFPGKMSLAIKLCERGMFWDRKASSWGFS